MRERDLCGEIDMCFVHTNQQVADIFAKVVGWWAKGQKVEKPKAKCQKGLKPKSPYLSLKGRVEIPHTTKFTKVVIDRNQFS